MTLTRYILIHITNFNIEALCKTVTCGNVDPVLDIIIETRPYIPIYELNVLQDLCKLNFEFNLTVLKEANQPENVD